jgi:hypothetical protein
MQAQNPKAPDLFVPRRRAAGMAVPRTKSPSQRSLWPGLSCVMSGEGVSGNPHAANSSRLHGAGQCRVAIMFSRASHAASLFLCLPGMLIQP